MNETPVTTPHAYHFSAGTNLPVTRIVLHDEEYPPSVHSAEDVAGYFAKASSGGSAHYVVDADSVEHPLSDATIAWHAPPNKGSIGIEHDGYARYSDADWAQTGSRATLARSAVLCATLCVRHGIPVVFLTAAQLKANPAARGITTHAQVTLAFRQSDHMDPGDHFPIQAYLTAVRAEVAKLTAKPTPIRPAYPPVTARPLPGWYHRLLRVQTPFMTGPDVKDVQERVHVRADGFYGPETARAVEAAQHRAHLTRDGIVGPDTARALG